MLKTRLVKEVAVPLWVAAKNLGKIAVSEEAFYAYLSCIITSICFVMECWDITVDTIEWAVNILVGEAPAVEEVLIDENLYLAAGTSADYTPVGEVLDWWVETAYNLFLVDDVRVGECWTTPILCGVEAPKALPRFKRRKGIRLLRK